MPKIRKLKLKLCLVGERGVGKTSLIRRFVFDEFDDSYIATLGAKVTKAEVVLPYSRDLEIKATLALFDILGQKGFRDLVRDAYFYGSQGTIGVCDLTRKDTLYGLPAWLDASQNITGYVPICLLANKVDLKEETNVSQEDLNWLGSHYQPDFLYLTSAKTGENVQKAFASIAWKIVEVILEKDKIRRKRKLVRFEILNLAEKRGVIGVSKNDVLVAFKEVPHNELMEEVDELESEGLVERQWSGPASFRIVITSSGIKALGHLDEEDLDFQS